jgi:hypothetical protein
VKIFFAYPSKPPSVRDPIEQLPQKQSALSKQLYVRLWSALDIPGKFIAAEITNAIDDSDLLAADVTYLNFNVLYEIGFAIGRGKRIVLTKNRSVAPDPDAAEVGIVDTLGYLDYSNSDELAAKLCSLGEGAPLPTATTKLTAAPVYVNQGRHRTDSEAKIVSGIKKLGLKFRSFDPNETLRLSAFDAIEGVTQSFGVVVHFIPNEMEGARVHNLRAAFIAGLADGLEVHTCFIQSGETPVPLDVRDFVNICTHPAQTTEALSRFQLEVMESLQTREAPNGSKDAGLFQTLHLGARSAENEMSELGAYYLEIDAYLRAQGQCRS